MILIRYLWYLLAGVGLVTLVAAAPAPSKTVNRVKASRASPTCVIGVPAVLPSDGSFPIPYYANVTPAGDDSACAPHYKLDSAWFKAHVMSDSGLNSTVDAYTAMKCQYTCNAADGCVSFIVSDHDGPCALFDALIEPALFVYDKNVKLWGACNKLCNPPKWPFTGSSKRDGVHYQPVRRGEKVIDPSSTDMVATDNCTETQVTPTAGWANYAPTKDFVTAHGHYIITSIETEDGAGFVTTHQACHTTCTVLTFCESVFISYVSDQWVCTLFDADLTPDLYVEGDEGGVNTWPYGFNQQCPS